MKLKLISFHLKGQRMLITKIFIFVACMMIFFGSTESAKAQCLYKYGHKWSEIDSVYQCTVQSNLYITTKDSVVIDKANRTHENVKTDKDVKFFFADNKNIQHFPRGLEKVFDNLIGIKIENGRINEIHQEDLKQYVKLEYLSLYQNDIKILEDGLFSYNPELKIASFEFNKIFHIDEHVFDRLHSLNQLKLETNQCINKNVGSNAAVKELIEGLKTECISNEFAILDMDLKELEQASTSATYKTCQDFGLEFEKFKNEFHHSKISSHAVIKDQIQKISNGGVQEQFCKVNAQFVELKVSLIDFEVENRKIMDQSAVDLNEKFAAQEKSSNEIRNQMMEMISNASVNFSVLNVSIETIMNNLNKTKEAQVPDTWKLSMLFITVFTQTLFLIIIYKKFFCETVLA